MRLKAPRGPLSSQTVPTAGGPAARPQRFSAFAGRARPSLLATFAIVSLIPLATLGFGLFYFLEGQIRSRALDGTRNAATLVARSSVEPIVVHADLRAPLAARLRQDLAASRKQLHAAGVVRIKLWNLDGKVVYSDRRDLVGRTFRPSDELLKAADGRIVSEVSDAEKAENVDDHGYGKLLEVYVPLRSSRGRVGSVFEMYMPYAPVAAAIANDLRTLALILLAGVAFLWAALFPVVARASKRLRRHAAEAEYLALHDRLTGLPNRALYLDRGRQALLAATRRGDRVGVLVVDLDRFKEINDTLGHRYGDELLRQVEPRLRSALRVGDTVARLGADEFGVLLSDVGGTDGAIDVVNRVRQAVEKPFVVDDVPVAIEATVGVALFPDHAENIDDLLQKAGVALHTAKAARLDWQLYEPRVDEHSRPRLTLLPELREALSARQLILYYQPQLDLATGTVANVEALVRWRHPTRGLLPPVEFLPVAEQTGFIHSLTRYVLDEALQQCKSWQSAGFDLGVAVNLSARSLGTNDLAKQVHQLLEERNVMASSLTLELTESAIMSDPFRAVTVLTELRAMGVRLSIDDFGTGYSSLAYLKRLPVTEIKIDRSFISNVTSDEDDAAIVLSTIQLAESLRLGVVAEGVETAATFEALIGFGCRRVQGFFLARPLPAKELEQWLRDRPLPEGRREAVGQWR
ncbi:MAG: EAL domain-containing protein [Actinobacteria bacterium]|nr:MAG: EAL domain-containing protein [Actinomycetota bacterium]